ncbi:MAG: hypothetical protein ACE5HX_04075 [bacterium]
MKKTLAKVVKNDYITENRRAKELIMRIGQENKMPSRKAFWSFGFGILDRFGQVTRMPFLEAFLFSFGFRPLYGKAGML